MAQYLVTYVQSRGISQESDYRWLKVRENSQIPEIPPVLKRPISIDFKTQVRVYDLIDSQTHSIVLARSDNELVLLVTGLKAREERTDFMGRKVRNSVAYVCSDSNDNELIIRSLAVRALRGELEGEVDKAVNIGGEYGFEVSFEKISQLARLEDVESLEAEQQIRIGENSIEFKEDLALELEQHCLPKTKRDSILIAVTGIKSKDALIQAKVWRSLSSRVKTQEWIKISNGTINVTANTPELEQNQQKKRRRFGRRRW